MKCAIEIAEAVRTGKTTAAKVLDDCLAGFALHEKPLRAATRILEARARADAQRVDAMIEQGRDPGILAGVPFGVKDLFDIAGEPTTAGSSIHANAPSAVADAEAIQRLGAVGAVLVATLNMDEFAYGFATINAMHGTTRNPHDLSRLAGGSSGGSAAIVAAGLLPFSLGSDTNGSIRVPASLTGIYGLKPTHRGLPLSGVFPFAESFDDIGPFTRSIADMERIWLALGGSQVPAYQGDLHIARLGGRFRENVDPDQLAIIDAIAPDAPLIELPDVARARSAAFLITAYEGGALHRDALAGQALSFDPATRDRLLAGALLPPALYEEAQDFRLAYQRRIKDLIADYHVLLAPATPCTAPPVNDPYIVIDGVRSPARYDLGVHTQPISFMGLPALSIPLRRSGKLPIGLQLVGLPNGEAHIFRFAAELEAAGITEVTVPPVKAIRTDIWQTSAA